MFRTFGENLKHLRASRNLTQNELAKEFHVAKTTISNYETGYSVPDISLLVQLADYFMVSIDDLIGRTNLFMEPEEVLYKKIPQVPLYRSLVSPDLMDDRQKIERYLATPDILLDGYSYFAYTIEDNLLTDYGLTQGDIVYVRADTSHKNDDLVFAFWESEKKVLIGKFYKDPDRICIAIKADRSLDITIGRQRMSKNVKILGKIAGVFKYLL